MLRLCKERLRSYTPQGGTEKMPGRPVRLCGRMAALESVIDKESTEVIVGVGIRYVIEGVSFGNEPRDTPR